MSLNNESSGSSDDESFQSSRSIIFSSDRSSSPAWSRSSSMSSGISAISTTSSESMRELKAKFGPITRPTPTGPPRPSSDPWRDSPVQQQNSQDSRPYPEQMKSNKRSFLPVPPKIVKPVINMPQPQGWITYSGPVYSPPMQHFPHPMMYHPPPAIQWPMTYPMPVPPVPMQQLVGPLIYSQPQARYVTVQMQHTYTWTYIDYSA